MQYRLSTLLLFVIAACLLAYAAGLEFRAIREIDLSTEVPVTIEVAQNARVKISYNLLKYSGHLGYYRTECNQSTKLRTFTGSPGQHELPRTATKIILPRVGYRSYILGRDVGAEPPYVCIEIITQSDSRQKAVTHLKSQWEIDGGILVR